MRRRKNVPKRIFLNDKCRLKQRFSTGGASSWSIGCTRLVFETKIVRFFLNIMEVELVCLITLFTITNAYLLCEKFTQNRVPCWTLFDTVNRAWFNGELHEKTTLKIKFYIISHTSLFDPVFIYFSYLSA